MTDGCHPWLLLLWLLRRLPRLSILVLRQGLKNLNRPGNHAVSVMVALGLGVAFVLTVYFIQTSLISQIVQSAPADFPNVFMLGITEQDEPELAEFLKGYGGLREPTLIPSVSSQLLTIDGHAPPDRWRRDRDREQEPDPEDQRRRPREFTLTWADALPPDTVIVGGVVEAALYGTVGFRRGVRGRTLRHKNRKRAGVRHIRPHCPGKGLQYPQH